MTARKWRLYVEDILNAVGDARSFVEGMSYEAFLDDRKTQFAVVRALEIIGEATKTVPDTVRARHPAVPWRDMAGRRDKFIHGDFGVK